MRDPNKTIRTHSLEISQATNLLFQTLTVSDLLRQFRKLGSLVSVEKNGEVVPESQYQAMRLRPGDRYTFTVVEEAFCCFSRKSDRY